MWITRPETHTRGQCPLVQAGHRSGRSLVEVVGLYCGPWLEFGLGSGRDGAGPSGHQRVQAQVDGKDFLIRGMNWGYVPVGTNYSYDLWSKPEPFIEEVLHREMKLLQAMEVNAIRLFNTVPPKWITWMRDNYGIYTAVNHLMGRYGFDVNGAFVPNIVANPGIVPPSWRMYRPMLSASRTCGACCSTCWATRITTVCTGPV